MAEWTGFTDDDLRKLKSGKSAGRRSHNHCEKTSELEQLKAEARDQCQGPGREISKSIFVVLLSALVQPFVSASSSCHKPSLKYLKNFKVALILCLRYD